MTAVGTIDIAEPSFADFYDELPLWSAPFALRLLERVPLQRGAQILEVGCGTGFLAIELAQRSGASAHVYAVDPWLEAMDRLDRKLRYRGISNVELIRRDAADTGLASGCVDLVVSNLGVNNFEDPPRILSECRRLLRPGGRLMMTTNLNGHMGEVYTAYREILQDLGLQDRRAALDADELRRGTAQSVSALLEASGFTEVTPRVDNFVMRFADGDALLGHWFIQMAFVPGWRRLVAEQYVTNVFGALARRLNIIAADRGDLALTVPVGVFEAVRA